MSTPKDIGPKRQEFDESQVKSCYDLINCWHNPWNNSENPVNLSPVTVAKNDIQNDLFTAGDQVSKVRMSLSNHELNQDI